MTRVSGSLVSGLALVGFVALLALVSLVWTPYSPDDRGEGLRLSAPGIAHWAGTDKLGRDVFTQLMIGARSALVVALGASLLAATLGVPLGLWAAASRPGVDRAIGSLLDSVIAFPTLLLAMLVVTAAGASTASAVVAIGVSASALVARVTRTNALGVLATDFVRAARACGTSTPAILWRHVLPNVAPLLGVQLTLVASGALLTEASLSYLGLGAAPPSASWGRLLLEAQSSVVLAPWGAIFPGVLIVVSVLGFQLLGDALRERLGPREAPR